MSGAAAATAAASGYASVSAAANIPLELHGRRRKQALVEQALRAGFHAGGHSLSARHYFRAGGGLGWSLSLRTPSWALEPWGRLYKPCTPPSGPGSDNTRAYDRDAGYDQQAHQSLKVSLENLRTDYLDSWVS
jgi:hypothetical protein